MYYLEYTIGSSLHVCGVWFSNQRNANFHLRSHQKSLIRDAFEENKEKKQNFVSTFMDFSNTGSCKCLNIFNSMKFDKIQFKLLWKRKMRDGCADYEHWCFAICLHVCVKLRI